MRLEAKSLLSVIALICLGFILGRMSVQTDVNAGPPASEVGRYQLILGDIDLPHFWFNEEDEFDTSWALRTGPTLFRIDTKTGDVDRYTEERITLRDTLSIWEHRWDSITGVEFIGGK